MGCQIPELRRIGGLLANRAWTSCRSVSRSNGSSQLLLSAQALRAAVYLRHGQHISHLTHSSRLKAPQSGPRRGARDDVGLEPEGQQIREEKQRFLPLVA